MTEKQSATCTPLDADHRVEAWVERHRRVGHHPHPVPTSENPERVDCGCGYIWRILTVQQITKKVARLKRELKEGEQARRRAAKSEQDRRRTLPSAPHPPLQLAQRYAAGPPRR